MSETHHSKYYAGGNAGSDLYSFPVTVDEKGTQVLMQAAFERGTNYGSTWNLGVAEKADAFQKANFPNTLKVKDLKARGLTVNAVLNAALMALKENGFRYEYSEPSIQNHICFMGISWGAGRPDKLIDTLTSDEFNKRLPELLGKSLAFENAKTELMGVMPGMEAEIRAVRKKSDYQQGIALQEMLVEAYSAGKKSAGK